MLVQRSSNNDLRRTRRIPTFAPWNAGRWCSPVVVFVARQRTREIGLRIALGAPPREILRLVIGDGMRLALWGAAVGVVLALGVGLIMSKLLFGIRPFEFWVVFPVLALLAASAFAACWFPARRAATMDPMETLRAE